MGSGDNGVRILRFLYVPAVGFGSNPDFHDGAYVQPIGYFVAAINNGLVVRPVNGERLEEWLLRFENANHGWHVIDAAVSIGSIVSRVCHGVGCPWDELTEPEYVSLFAFVTTVLSDNRDSVVRFTVAVDDEAVRAVARAGDTLYVYRGRVPPDTLFQTLLKLPSDSGDEARRLVYENVDIHEVEGPWRSDELTLKVVHDMNCHGFDAGCISVPIGEPENMAYIHYTPSRSSALATIVALMEAYYNVYLSGRFEVVHDGDPELPLVKGVKVLDAVYVLFSNMAAESLANMCNIGGALNRRCAYAMLAAYSRNICIVRDNHTVWCGALSELTSDEDTCREAREVGDEMVSYWCSSKLFEADMFCVATNSETICSREGRQVYAYSVDEEELENILTSAKAAKTIEDEKARYVLAKLYED